MEEGLELSVYAPDGPLALAARVDRANIASLLGVEGVLVDVLALEVVLGGGGRSVKQVAAADLLGISGVHDLVLLIGGCRLAMVEVCMVMLVGEFEGGVRIARNASLRRRVVADMLMPIAVLLMRV